MMRPTSARSSFEIDSATFLGEGQIDFFILQKRAPRGVCIACSPSASLTESTKEDEQQLRETCKNAVREVFQTERGDVGLAECERVGAQQNRLRSVHASQATATSRARRRRIAGYLASAAAMSCAAAPPLASRDCHF